MNTLWEGWTTTPKGWTRAFILGWVRGLYTIDVRSCWEDEWERRRRQQVRIRSEVVTSAYTEVCEWEASVGPTQPHLKSIHPPTEGLLADVDPPPSFLFHPIPSGPHNSPPLPFPRPRFVWVVPPCHVAFASRCSLCWTESLTRRCLPELILTYRNSPAVSYRPITTSRVCVSLFLQTTPLCSRLLNTDSVVGVSLVSVGCPDSCEVWEFYSSGGICTRGRVCKMN